MKSMPRIVGVLSILALAVPAACGKKDTPAAPDAAPTTTKAATGESKPGGEEPAPRRDPEPDKGEPEKDKAEPDKDKPGTDEPERPASQVAVPDLPGPFATSALAAVPKSAPLVFVGSPKRFLDAIGYDQLRAKYGPMISQVGQQMVQVAGKDFFELASWAEIGIDLEGIAGGFMPDLQSESIVSFFAVSDSAKLLEFLKGIAEKTEMPLKTEAVGGATLIKVDDRDRNVMLLTDTHVFTVNKMRGNGAAAMAKELLDRPAAESIVSLPDLKATLTGLAADEVGALIQIRKILDMSLAMMAELGGSRGAELDFMKAIVSELSTMAVGLDISERAAEATVKFGLSADGRLKKMVRNASDVQPLLKALDDEPLVLLSGQVDPKAYFALIEQAMATEGDDFAEMQEELEKELGIDLEKDVIGALTGEFGFALTGDVAELLAADDPESKLGGILLLGIQSDTALKALITTVTKMPGIGAVLKWDEAAGTLDINMPGRQAIRVSITDKRLVASTDPGALARLSGAETFAGKIANAKLKTLLERKDLAGLFTMQQRFVMTWMMARMAPGDEIALPPDASAELKAKHAELVKIEAEIKPLRAKVEEAEMKPIIDAFDKLGTLAEAVTIDDHGVRATIGFYPKASVTDTITSLIELGMRGAQDRAGGEHPDRARLNELEDKRWKLRSELWDMKHEIEDEHDHDHE